ncbi:helix-turn-helix domain-containing protein [Microbacterium sp. bgisy203]|uniref:helix-turn-helix domain-containing protein n=1 Tax=Microbacterium sp. bgisy203 TaxID=3413799 RepID=UPI003D71703B
MRTIETTWHLRELMSQQRMFQTTALQPLLAERGVRLSREQVYRLVAHTPQRLNIEVLGALCDILNCSPADLISVRAKEALVAVNDGEQTRTPIGSLRPPRAELRDPGAS